MKTIKELCAAAAVVAPGRWFTWGIKDYITIQCGPRWIGEVHAYGIQEPTVGDLEKVRPIAELIARCNPQTIMAVVEALESGLRFANDIQNPDATKGRLVEALQLLNSPSHES